MSGCFSINDTEYIKSCPDELVKAGWELWRNFYYIRGRRSFPAAARWEEFQKVIQFARKACFEQCDVKDGKIKLYKVVYWTDPMGPVIGKHDENMFYSIYDSRFIYEVGETQTVNLDPVVFTECSSGIHCYRTMNEAFDHLVKYANWLRLMSTIIELEANINDVLVPLTHFIPLAGKEPVCVKTPQDYYMWKLRASKVKTIREVTVDEVYKCVAIGRYHCI